MNKEQINEPTLADHLYDYAFDLYRKEDKNVYEIKKLLIEKGLSAEEAAKLAREVEHNIEIEIRQKGRREILVGIGCTVGGCLITYSSYSLAVSKGGGMFIISYGLIIGGVVSIFRGVGRFS